MITNKKTILAAYLLALYISYLAGTTCFVHTHIIDGYPVTHSHPYRGTPDNPGHGHSTAQFQTIANLACLLAFAASTVALVCLLTGKRILRSLAIPCFGRMACLLSYSLRAPPRR